jgi:hypothetical protein
MIISVLIMAVFTVAAGILLFSTPVDAPVIPVESPSINDPDDGVVSLPAHPTPPPPPPPEPSPVIQLDIASITMRLGESNWNRESFTLTSSDSRVEFNFSIEPVGFDVADDFHIDFISNNEDVVTVEEVIIGRPGRYGFRVSRVGPGNTRVRIVVVNNGVELEWSRPVHVR